MKLPCDQTLLNNGGGLRGSKAATCTLPRSISGTSPASVTRGCCSKSRRFEDHDVQLITRPDQQALRLHMLLEGASHTATQHRRRKSLSARTCGLPVRFGGSESVIVLVCKGSRSLHRSAQREHAALSTCASMSWKARLSEERGVLARNGATMMVVSAMPARGDPVCHRQYRGTHQATPGRIGRATLDTIVGAYGENR